MVNAAGEAVKPEGVFTAVNPTTIPDIELPKKAGDYSLRLWLEDEVGFVGPATVAPIPHDTTPPAAPQAPSVVAPNVSRSAQGFDVRCTNLQDGGSPINAAYYQVLGGDGRVVVPTHDLEGQGVSSIADLDTPNERGSYSLRLWLSDEEGNVGAPVTTPLAYECVRSETVGGSNLSASFEGAPQKTVEEGQSAILSGSPRQCWRPGRLGDALRLLKGHHGRGPRLPRYHLRRSQWQLSVPLQRRPFPGRERDLSPGAETGRSGGELADAGAANAQAEA